MTTSVIDADERVVARGFWKGRDLWWTVSDGREIVDVSDVALRTIASAKQRYPFNYIDVVRRRDVEAYWRNRPEVSDAR